MPTPASQPEEQRLPSPVPRYSVSCFLSEGSSTSVPTEFWSSPFTSIWCQSGFGAVAFSVFQTPPPAAPAHRRHFLAVQSGSATSEVMRLAVLLVAPEKARAPGSVAFSCGPICSHLWPLPLGSPFFSSLAAMP